MLIQSKVFRRVGNGIRELEWLRKMLGHHSTVYIYLLSVLEALADESSTVVLGAVQSFRWILVECSLYDVVLNWEEHQRLEALSKWHDRDVPADQLDVLFPKVKVNPAIVEAEINSLDIKPSLDEEQADAFLRETFSLRHFQMALVRLCLVAIRRHRDRMTREQCALLIQDLSERCFFIPADAERIERRIEQMFGEDPDGQIYGILIGAAKFMISISNELPKGESPDETDSSHV